MARKLRSISHEDQLTLVEHLDELRTRLIISLAVFAAAFALCFWQQDFVVAAANRPFESATRDQAQRGPLARNAEFQQQIAQAFRAQAQVNAAVAAEEGASQATKEAATAAAERFRRLADNVPPLEARQPVTLGVAEPFTQTFKVAAYAALLLSLPILLWQLYAFILPAFTRSERKVAFPLMLMVPVLFSAGALFAYFVVLPQAIEVLQNFNAGNFDILIQARDLYRFTILTCIAMGALFQVPIAVLLATRTGLVTVPQLRTGRRYAILGIAVFAMLLPGTDPVTMILAMAPLVVLYELSILLAAALDRRARRVSSPDVALSPKDD